MKILSWLPLLAVAFVITACGAVPEFPVYVHETGGNQSASGLPATTDQMYQEVPQYREAQGFAQGAGIHLPSVRGEILRVKSPKGWDPKKPETCASLHLIPVRSTGEGGPNDARFAHKKIETVCLNPGTDLFNLENPGNGFIKASIAVRNVGEYSYELLQRLALDSKTISYTTEGDPVIRAYVFFTDKHYGRWEGPPKVALDPFGGTSGRHKYEEGVYSGALNARSLSYTTTPNVVQSVGGNQCGIGKMVMHGWDLNSLPNNLQNAVRTAENDNRSGFVAAKSFSTMYGKSLRDMASSGGLRRTNKRPTMTVSIIGADGSVSQSIKVRMSAAGMAYAKFEQGDLPNGSVVQVVVPAGSFSSPSINPVSGKRELRLDGGSVCGTINAHVVLN